jgi:hypothetical protein
MFDTIPSDEVIVRTIEALKINGIDAIVVDQGEAVTQKLLEMIPAGSSIMNMTSRTLDTIGVMDALERSGKYTLARAKLMNPATTPHEKLVIGATSDYTLGSVHAATQDGKLMIASNTGSQLSAEAYSSPHVIFVVGAQKIVENMEQGMKRIYEHVLPLESVRANKAYNITSGSFVSKLLVINREVNKERIKVILVKETLGF